MSFILSPPRAPSEQLRLDSFRILSRLLLIVEFKPWFCRETWCSEPDQAYRILWECFSLGAPLCTLLNLLSPPYHGVAFEFELSMDERVAFFEKFIERVRLLEIQGLLPYGEVLRVDDMFGRSNPGFARVLKTIQNILCALQGSYPGLFVVPYRSQYQRQAFVQNLLDTERAHACSLGMVAESVLMMSETTGLIDPGLECLLVNRTHLREYHDRVLSSLEKVVAAPWLENWITTFNSDHITFRTRTVSAYRSICVNYLPMFEFLQNQLELLEPALKIHAQTLLNILGHLPSRISEYCSFLAAILQVSSPSEHPSYDTLCTVLFQMREASETIDEMSRQIRTMRAARILKARAYLWDSEIDPASLGSLLLDDILMEASGTRYAVFLFEAMLLCCLDGAGDRRPARYPTKPWELGPGLREKSLLNLVHAIPTSCLGVVRITSDQSFSIEWKDARTLELNTTCSAQNEQWGSLLGFFAAAIDNELCSRDSLDNASLLSEDEDAGGRRRSHPRPWSIIARKGPQSESSSFIRQDFGNNDILLSPGLLPTLFNGTSDPPKSPSSGETHFTPLSLHFDPPPTPPPGLDTLDKHDPSILLDLTGKVTREGRFPEALGGFSDVWKGLWMDGLRERRVAIKVLRSRVDNPAMEEKMKLRLWRELNMWKKLDHPNILPLLGVVSDFGRYDAMICPWLDNGSVTNHMERCGDLLSMTDRLQLLCEVAEGLRYLHSFNIIHGDLTGSNILINDQGKALLGDFGLSSIVAEFDETSCMTSGVSGAVRWADASLYKLLGDDEDDRVPSLTTMSDVYSFGSVTLEILSGRIPYHYVRTDAQVIIELHNGKKPRRPAPSFVTNAQWDFIQRCWADDPQERPDVGQVLASIQGLYRTSLDFRRHSA
ncbi:TKL/TKL-ccin protein kinase [Desarmillaria tabescens]|uniref:TKL/TKL-ccin protein kinase n=1 Tax=Armillaria tabescens TaxID=1929756 RepID=A0AA39NC68_ARMTA|nr:TKL/TKL-ccin protein kinase [Desarmillaria tabescens]KAK0462909.1 TKL/TKL-ccin protein kinase [Desarmillaria tabescens]